MISENESNKAEFQANDGIASTVIFWFLATVGSTVVSVYLAYCLFWVMGSLFFSEGITEFCQLHLVGFCFGAVQGIIEFCQFLLVGFCVGTVQWFVLRRWISRRWIVATAFASFVGFLIYEVWKILPKDIQFPLHNISRGHYLFRNSTLTAVPVLGAMVLGYAQAAVLKRRSGNSAYLWIILCVVPGWILGVSSSRFEGGMTGFPRGHLVAAFAYSGMTAMFLRRVLVPPKQVVEKAVIWSSHLFSPISLILFAVFFSVQLQKDKGREEKAKMLETKIAEVANRLNHCEVATECMLKYGPRISGWNRLVNRNENLDELDQLLWEYMDILHLEKSVPFNPYGPPEIECESKTCVLKPNPAFPPRRNMVPRNLLNK